jgi:hypothetical protein
LHNLRKDPDVLWLLQAGINTELAVEVQSVVVCLDLIVEAN